MEVFSTKVLSEKKGATRRFSFKKKISIKSRRGARKVKKAKICFGKKRYTKSSFKK